MRPGSASPSAESRLAVGTCLRGGRYIVSIVQRSHLLRLVGCKPFDRGQECVCERACYKYKVFIDFVDDIMPSLTKTLEYLLEQGVGSPRASG